MFKYVIPLSLMFSSAVHAGPKALDTQEENYLFKASDGTEVESVRGSFLVPENRANPDSRQIKLSYVKFPSTNDNPGAPIIYLAGGPGGSGVGTARGPRFPLFMAMREFGDVIAFDQRGTGWSNHIPKCNTDHKIPLSEPLTPSAIQQSTEASAVECTTFWKEQGVDLAGYNSKESAKDIETLRMALGAKKISLWGISYGSHLALATIKEMAAHIDRIVLAGFEGLDQTVKLPAHTNAYFDRLQQAIDADPGAKAAFPDLASLMRTVLEKLDKNPIETSFTDRSGNEIKLTVGKTDLQLLTSYMIADPRYAVRIPATYAMAARGDVSRVAPLIYRFLRSETGAFDGMSEAMDIMSGISADRLALVTDQAKASLLGDLLNFPMPHMIGGFGLKDLGDDFRSPVETSIPTLVLTGTLDGRTYPEAAKSGLQGFSKLSHVIVENGGHNIFMQDPKIADLVLRFMRGENVETKVNLDMPKFLY